MTEQKKKKERPKRPNPVFLRFLIDSRALVQRFMLDLIEFHNQFEDGSRQVLSEPKNNQESTAFQLFVGGAFSLWRALFLADAKRETPDIIEECRLVLEKVLADNTFTYAQDRELRNWTGGFYLNNARYRIERIVQNKLPADETKDVPELQPFFPEKKKSFGQNQDSVGAWNQYFTGLKKAFEIYHRLAKQDFPTSPS